MKYYDEILDLGIFTRQDIQKIIQNPKTAESFLSRSLIKGYIKRIKQKDPSEESRRLGERSGRYESKISDDLSSGTSFWSGTY